MQLRWWFRSGANKRREITSASTAPLSSQHPAAVRITEDTYSGLSITPVYLEQRNIAIGATQSSLHDFPLYIEEPFALCCASPRVPIMVATYLSILTYCNIDCTDRIVLLTRTRRPIRYSPFDLAIRA